MKEIKIETTKTARVFFEGELTPKTQEIVLVLHGYGQLAEFFIKKFKGISTDSRVIVAPEGLSRFYWQGMNGRVVASWMTKVDRVSEINDQLIYLDKVLQFAKEQAPNATVSTIGFSQGTATLCRWLASTSFAMDRVMLWAGAIPEDVYENAAIKNTEFELVIGKEDEFISEEQIEITRKKLTQNKINFSLIRFDGKHQVNSQLLMDLFRVN